MDYLALAETLDKDLIKAVDLINNPEVSPNIRQQSFEILFRELGENVYKVIYDMATFDMDVVGTTGTGIDMQKVYGISKVASDSVVVGDKSGTQASIRLWLDDVISKASQDAFNTAHDLGKHPTLHRSEKANCCKWCAQHVGTFINPSPEVFRRHANCRATIIVSGYKSRNGLLKNYWNPNKKH